jgi:RNase H-fold protein (predicted Holliday junction resolvase)
MSSVIKKKKKTLTAKIIERVKGGSNQHKQEDIVLGIPLNVTQMDSKDMETIVSRRKELRAMKHDNSDAMVKLNDGDQP